MADIVWTCGDTRSLLVKVMGKGDHHDRAINITAADIAAVDATAASLAKKDATKEAKDWAEKVRCIEKCPQAQKCTKKTTFGVPAVVSLTPDKRIGYFWDYYRADCEATVEVEILCECDGG